MSFLDNFRSKRQSSDGDYSSYIDLDKFEKDIDLSAEAADTYIRIAVFTNLEQIPVFKKEIYDGNILIIDISNIKSDDRLRNHLFNELKDVVLDVHGDIVGMKDNNILVTPTGIKVDRRKIGGNY
ncbi:cell division protein SepF [Methanosarcinaceae archaeon]|nr:cell division protein SepF [Methanosarcinaceae archaeon]MBQ3620067.1 cell division protein SepF [Methanosarcinaceae archaeon]